MGHSPSFQWSLSHNQLFFWLLLSSKFPQFCWNWYERSDHILHDVTFQIGWVMTAGAHSFSNTCLVRIFHYLVEHYKRFFTSQQMLVFSTLLAYRRSPRALKNILLVGDFGVSIRCANYIKDVPNGHDTFDNINKNEWDEIETNEFPSCF